MKSQLADNSALMLNANSLKQIGDHCQRTARNLGSNTEHGRAFANLEAAIWVMLDLHAEATTRAAKAEYFDGMATTKDWSAK